MLIEFYRKVRPFGPGWKLVRDEAGLGEDAARTAGENIPLALLGWVAGCATIWSALFTVGNFLYGRTGYALTCLAVFAVAGLALVRVVEPTLGEAGRGLRNGPSGSSPGAPRRGAPDPRTP